MAVDNTNSSLYKRLIELQAGRPQNAVMPSQSAGLNFRDAKIKALQAAPGLTERLNSIAAGEPPKPSGALGTLGSMLVNNPVSKLALSGLSAIDVPRRLVISGIKEFKDAVDGDPNSQASFKDYKDQVADPTFGFGRVVPMDGWGGRIIGFIGDVALDPLTYATLGGTISKKSIVQTGKIPVDKLAAQAAKRADELASFGLNGVSDTVLDVLRKTPNYAKQTSTREFLGTKTLQGRRGSEALASGARKLGATDSEIAEILKRGRRGLTDDMAELMGIGDYGIYYFGSRLRVPFSGIIGRGLASGLTTSRLSILNTRAGEYLGKMITPSGTAANLDLRDIRFAGRAGKPLPGGLTPKMGLAILDADNASRGARGIAARDGANIVSKALNDPDVIAEATVIYKYLDTDIMPTNITDRQRRAMLTIQKATDELYNNIDSYGKFVAGDEPGGFVIAGIRKKFFPHKMTQAAQNFVENSSSKRAVDIRQYLKIDHSNIGGSFESRNLERLVKNGERVEWFDYVLTEKDIAGGVDRLNELARLGGFKGDFFETDIRKALTSYLTNYAEGIGTIAFYQNLKESGNDIAGMAVKRGMITKETLDSILTQPARTAKMVQQAYSNAKKEMSNYIKIVETESTAQLRQQTKRAGLTQDELGTLLITGPDAEQLVAQKTAAAVAADEAKRVVTTQNVQKAIMALDNARADIIAQQAKYTAQFQEQSIVLAEQEAHHLMILESIDLNKATLNQYIDVIAQKSELPPAAYVDNLKKNLQIMQDVVAQNAAEIENKFNIFSRDSLEFLNDAMSDLSNYTTVGNKNASQVITSLKNLAEFGQVQLGRNVKGRGGERGLNFDTVIRPYLNATEKAVPIGDQSQWNAWIDLKNSLELDTVTKVNLDGLTISDVRETLARAASSTDPQDLGDVRAAISWLFVRAQVDNPDFAKNLLANPSDEYKTILNIVKNDNMRKKWGILKVVEDKLDGYVFTNIEELPSELKLPGRWLKLHMELRELDKKLVAIPEHLARVPDTGLGITNRVYSLFADVFGGYDQTQVLKPEGYDAIINQLKQLDANEKIIGLDDYVKQLEATKGNPNSQISLGEISGDIQERFAAAESRLTVTDQRLSNNELALYPELDTQPGLPLRNRIIQKQNQLQKERAEKILEQNKLTSRLPKEVQEEINFLTNSTTSAPIDIAKTSMELAQATMNFYIKTESQYVLRVANDMLGATGRTLTPQGHARMTHQIYEKFARTTTEHVESLEKAKNLLEPIAEEVVASGKNAQDMQILLLARLRSIMNNPEEREILQDVFPNLVLNLELKKLSDIKIYLSSDLEYQNIIESIADIEVKAFPVSQMSSSGGAGVIDFKQIADPVMAAKMEKSRRAQESVLGSEGLQKAKILQNFANSSHEGYKTYLKNLKTRIGSNKNFSKETKNELFFDIDVQAGRLDDQYAIVQKELTFAKAEELKSAAETKAARKASKSLSSRMSGPSRIKELQRQTREYKRNRVAAGYFEYQPNSIDSYINEALNGSINSTRPIKELFGALFGGEKYATPTLRGSEAGRLASSGTLSLQVMRSDDSFFVKNLKQATAMRDQLRSRVYSSNPEEAQVLGQRAAYVQYLQDTLDDLEVMIKEKPEAMKLLKQATKDLSVAEKQIAEINGVPLSYEERMAYIDHVRAAFGEIKPRTSVFDLETRQWKYTTQRKAGRPDLQPMPENIFTPEETVRVRQYIDAKTKYDQFVSTEEYGLAAREESIMKFRRELAAADLSKLKWTVTGETSNAMSWSPQLYKQIADDLTFNSPGNLPFNPGDVILQASQKGSVAKLIDPFNTDLPKLINRMSDALQPELIFIDVNSKEVKLRVARNADGSSLGYLEKLRVKTTVQPPEPTPASIIVDESGRLSIFSPENRAADYDELTAANRTTYETVYEPWDSSMERLSVIEPASVTVGVGQKASKQTLTGEKFNPNEAWVAVQKTNQYQPTEYVRMSSMLDPVTNMETYIPLPARMGGGNFNFTPLEQEALFTDFLSDYYKRNLTYFTRPSAFAAEVKRREQQILNIARQIKISVDNINTRQGTKLSGNKYGGSYSSRVFEEKVIKSLSDDIQILKDDLEEFVRAKDVYDVRKSANAKTAALYNFFNSTDNRSQSNMLSGVTGNLPHTKLQSYIDGQNVVDDIENSVKVSQEVVRERRAIVDGLWVGTPEESMIAQARNLTSDVQGVMMQYGQSTESLLSRVISARATYDNAIKIDALKADMQKAVLTRDLGRSTEGTSLSMPEIRSGVAVEQSLAKQRLSAGPFVEDLPGRQPMVDDLTRQQIAYNPRQYLREEIGAAAQKQSDSFGMEPAESVLGSVPGDVQLLKDLEQEVAWLQAVQLKETNVLTAMIGAGKKTSTEIDQQSKLLAQSEQELIKINKKLTTLQENIVKAQGKLASPLKQDTALDNARKAFDAAQAATTPEDINVAIVKIAQIDKMLKSSAQIKASLKALKGREGYEAFVTEFELFVEEANRFAKIATSPSVDQNIRDQAGKWIMANTEYYKQVATLSSEEHMARIAQGLTKRDYLKTITDKDGKVRQEVRQGAEFVPGTGLNTIETDWISSFDHGMVQLSKQFPTTGVAPQIAEFVQNVHRLQEPAVVRELNMFLGQYTRFFKAYATLSPGFHVRNSISNGFMLFAAGGNARYLTEGLQMSRSLNEASRAGKSVEQWIESLPIGKQVNARIAVRASFASGGGNAADNLRQLYMSGRMINNPLTRGSKGLGQWIEGHSRFMLAYDGAMQGMDFNTSAARVQRFLIDYEDVSTLDKSLRQIIPFWMWTSRNMPMQIQNIWLNPRAYQVYGNAKRNFRNDQEGDVVPVWMQEMGAWKLPFGQNLYAAPDIGFNRLQSDVNMLQDPTRFLSNVNPLIRLPIELTGERQLFSNKRFSKTPVEISGGVGAALQPLMELLGYGETGPGGKKFVDDKAYYALRNLIPLLGRTESLSPSMPTDPGKSTVNPLFGLLGAPVKEVNQQIQNNELLRRQFDMQELAKRSQAVNNPQG